MRRPRVVLRGGVVVVLPAALVKDDRDIEPCIAPSVPCVTAAAEAVVVGVVIRGLVTIGLRLAAAAVESGADLDVGELLVWLVSWLSIFGSLRGRLRTCLLVGLMTIPQ